MKKLLFTPIVLSVFLGSSPITAATLLDQFDPTVTAGLVAIAIEPTSGNLLVYENFGGATIHVLNQTGAEITEIPSPGVNSNDYDLDYSLGPMNIGGTDIPADTLLVFNGDDSPEKLYALDAAGTILAQVDLETISLVGGTHIPATNQVATVDYTGEDFIRVLNASDGSEAGFFNPGPPPFDIFYGDIDVSTVTGEITVVSSSQNIVRQLTQQGFCVRELEVGQFGITAMSGVAIDDATGNLWITNTGGLIFHLDPRPDVGDSDGDGLLDFDDNCTQIANAGQQDSDGDGIGNACDADLAGPAGTNDCLVNFLDLNAFSAAFFTTPASPNWNPDADLTGPAGAPDGFVNFLDLARVSDQFFAAPGPSGRGNLCGCGL